MFRKNIIIINNWYNSISVKKCVNTFSLSDQSVQIIETINIGNRYYCKTVNTLKSNENIWKRWRARLWGENHWSKYFSSFCLVHPLTVQSVYKLYVCTAPRHTFGNTDVFQFHIVVEQYFQVD